MTNNLNEQMREKADEIVSTYGEHDGSPSECFQLLESLIASALLEAHAAGRQEILDRLPSDEEIEKARWLDIGLIVNGKKEKSSNSWTSACEWFRKRLMGEGDSGE